MKTFEEFESSLKQLREEVGEYCEKYGRDPASVAILPVTKRQPLDAVRYAEEAGFSAVGENVVQEATRKAAEYSGQIQWELIGHLQSNKAKIAVETFERIQTVDTGKLVKRLNRLAGEQETTQRILLQINTAGDPAKHGAEADDAEALVEEVLDCPHLLLEGFMTIGRLSPDPNEAEQAFIGLRELRDQLEAEFGHSFPELSMGMSGDIEMAVKAGSTQIRVGTRLFGERPPSGQTA